MSLSQQEINKSAITAAIIVNDQSDEILLDWMVQLRTEAQKQKFIGVVHAVLAGAVGKPIEDISREFVEDVVRRIERTLELRFPAS